MNRNDAIDLARAHALAMDPCPLFRYAAELYSVQEHLWPAPASKTPNVAIKPRRQASA